MKSAVLRIALALSLLLNLGVLGAVGYRALHSGTQSEPPGILGSPTALPRLLGLDDAQRRSWHESEAAFLAQLDQAGTQIRGHRDRIIREIFGEAPDTALIDTERRTIARLQDQQQRQVIAQLLLERELLSPSQRQRLATILLNQPVGPSSIERLHRD